MDRRDISSSGAMIKENHEADKKGLNKYIDGIYEEKKGGDQRR